MTVRDKELDGNPPTTRADRVQAPYPPQRQGLSGDDPEALTVMLDLRSDASAREWPQKSLNDKPYDLAIVGAGISGLSAAYFYQQQHPNARILVLDNHADFGGHAQRNEFSVDGKNLIGYGGSQSLHSPQRYSTSAQSLLEELHVDVDALANDYDQSFFARNGLAGGLYFNEESWGTQTLVRYDLRPLAGFLPLADSALRSAEAVAQMPLSKTGQQELLALLEQNNDQLAHIPLPKRAQYLDEISYKTFLQEHMGIQSEDVFKLLQNMASDSGVCIATASAAEAIGFNALPGGRATGVSEFQTRDAYIHHFPDGNAGIARRLVRKLVPQAFTGADSTGADNKENILQQTIDYQTLDDPDAAVRLRLSSTVTRVYPPEDASPRSGNGNTEIRIDYVREGVQHTVRAAHCIFACEHSVIPTLCPELPSAQRTALAHQVRTPVLYTNVALRNWRAWHDLGLGAVLCPGSYHIHAALDFPVNCENYRYACQPSAPILVHLERFFTDSDPALGKQDQLREGQEALLKTDFATIEKETRKQLAGILRGTDFDPERDIAGITANRWIHGYAYDYDFRHDPRYENWNDERYPHVQARKRFGNIAIANSDAAATSMLDAAIDEAHRAVCEITQS